CGGPLEEPCHGIPRCARHRILHELVAALAIALAVGECAPLCVCQYRRDLGDSQRDGLAVEGGRDERAHLAERCGIGGMLPRRSSIRTRSVTSRAIFDAPTTRPVSSRIGDTVSETERLVPSFRWRTVS